MDGFKEWVNDQEMTEGLMDNPSVRRVVVGLWDWLKDTGMASKLQFDDTRRAIIILRRRLAATFGGAEKPTQEQLQAAWKAIAELPKVGAVLVSLVSPVPGLFTGIMIATIAIKRVFGVSILPAHFERAWLKPDSFMGKMSGIRYQTPDIERDPEVTPLRAPQEAR